MFLNDEQINHKINADLIPSFVVFGCCPMKIMSVTLNL